MGRYFDRVYPHQEVLKEELKEVKMTDEELAEHDNLTVSCNCNCGFPLSVELKKNGKKLISSGEHKIICFLCKEEHTLIITDF